MAPALVLGSAQPASLVDQNAADGRGVDVVRRRSGGGAVLVVPDDPLWVDVWIPVGDPLFVDDVGRAFWWLGDVWSRALAQIGVLGPRVSHTPAARGQAVAAVACFGTTGSGEVTADDGRKVVGLAQRRVRHGALFHTAALGSWAPEALVELLALEPGARARLADRLAPAAVGVVDLLGGDRPEQLGRLADAFLDALP